MLFLHLPIKYCSLGPTIEWLRLSPCFSTKLVSKIEQKYSQKGITKTCRETIQKKGLCMMVCQKPFWCITFLPPLLVLPYPFNLPWSSPSDVTAGNKAMSFSADCCAVRPNIGSTHRLHSCLLTESGHPFFWSRPVHIPSFTIYFPQLCSSSCLLSESLLTTNKHTRFACLCYFCLATAGLHNIAEWTFTVADFSYFATYICYCEFISVSQYEELQNEVHYEKGHSKWLKV